MIQQNKSAGQGITRSSTDSRREVGHMPSVSEPHVSKPLTEMTAADILELIDYAAVSGILTRQQSLKETLSRWSVPRVVFIEWLQRESAIRDAANNNENIPWGG